jgi:hypothetical protein
VQLVPVTGLPDKRRGVFNRDALGAALSGTLLEVQRPSGRPALAFPAGSRAFDLPVRANVVQRMRRRLPALPLLDARDRPVRDLVVKPLLTVKSFSVSELTRFFALVSVACIGDDVSSRARRRRCRLRRR